MNADDLFSMDSWARVLCPDCEGDGCKRCDQMGDLLWDELTLEEQNEFIFNSEYVGPEDFL